MSDRVHDIAGELARLAEDVAKPVRLVDDDKVPRNVADFLAFADAKWYEQIINRSPVPKGLGFPFAASLNSFESRILVGR